MSGIPSRLFEAWGFVQWGYVLSGFVRVGFFKLPWHGVELCPSSEVVSGLCPVGLIKLVKIDYFR